jgi:CubicO group peptidase (beta-lactamase class C family)
LLGTATRNLWLVAVILLLSSAGASGQTTSTGSGSQTDVTARVDKLFERWNRTDSPGCALSVMRYGRIVYEHGYGMADLDHNVTITPSTVFHVASMSKQFTAASIVLLAQQGKLSFDDDIRKYIPELHDFGTPITIRELIHHTSGLRDQWELLGLAGWRYSLDLITNDDVMSLITRQKELNFKPGDKNVYSNTGYTLLGLIVQRVSGMSLRAFTTANIFEPLGMKNTHFRDDHAEIVKNNAYGYAPEKDGTFRLSNTNFDTVGATSLHTTVEDIALWDENFYHLRVGGPGFVPQMLERGKLNSGEQIDYAFGLVIGKYKGLPTVDHAGGDAGYRSDMTRFPEQHFSSAVLCNSSNTDPTSLVQKVADIYLAQEIKAAMGPDSPAAATAAPGAVVLPTGRQLDDDAGLYWDREDDNFVKTYMKEDKLHIAFGVNTDFVLKPASDSLFHLADVSFGDQVNLTFEPAAQDKPRRLLNSFGDGKPIVYESVEAFAPSATALAEYAGEYTSEEIDPVYRIDVQDGKLMLKRLKNKPTELEPCVRDAFCSSLGTIRFTRDPTGHISGFLLSDGRILNFRFTRQRQ